MYNLICIMKRSKLFKSVIAATSLLMVCSCAPKEQDSSNPEQSSSSVYVDPNTVFVPSVTSIDQKLNSQFSIQVEYEEDGVRGEITLTRYNQYMEYEDTSERRIPNCFVKNESGTGLFYSKDEDGRYASFVCKELDFNQYYKEAFIGQFSYQTLMFKSNQEITYLGRECIKYTNHEEISNNINDSLVMDKETGLILHCDLEYWNNIYQRLDYPNFKFDVTAIYLGDEAKGKIGNKIDSICVSSLDSTMLQNLGFQGELETPNFAISDCSTEWEGEDLKKYTIEYKDKVNSGNDTYINQFETFTTCLYNMGFKKPSSQALDCDYQALVIDSTIEYDADITFAAFATKNNKTYKTESHLTVKGGQASIAFELTSVI